jgi:hypothetical protein
MSLSILTAEISCLAQKPNPKVTTKTPANAFMSVDVEVAFASVDEVSVPDLCVTFTSSLSLSPP